MDNPSNQIAERLQQATNILVTVSKNPSVDQLSSAIGLTLLLNKLGKHAVAVFSGNVPSTLKFLQPEKTFEKTTDSLRDFIIALDKSKADKLRYKVEDQMVKIFITPYRTSISEKDLEFNQGDFNVEVVIALGVSEQKDLDQAIIAHGRILHDATVVSINTEGKSPNLGSINWVDPQASSLAEMLVSLSTLLKAGSLDSQMATAFLTGIVAETERFSNDKTSSTTMQVSSQLMAAGANQQLVATQLENPSEALTPSRKSQTNKDGSLDIDHESNAEEELPEPEVEQIQIDENGEIGDTDDEPKTDDSTKSVKSKERGLALEPPTLGGRLTANTEPENLDPSTDPLGSNNQNGPLLSHAPVGEPAKDEPKTPANLPDIPHDPIPSESTPMPPHTLADLEEKLHSSHLQPPAAAPETPMTPEGNQELSAARDAVAEAMQASPPPVEPLQRLNAQPMDLDLSQLAKPTGISPIPPTGQAHQSSVPEALPPQQQAVPLPPSSPSPDLPPGLVPTTPPVDNTASSVTDPTAPPPVAPPFTFPEDAPPEQPPAGPPK